MRSLSLRSRLLLWASAASALTLIAVILLVDATFRDTIHTQLEENLSVGRQVVEGARARQIDAHISDAANLALDTRLRAAVATGDPATVAQTLAEVFPRQPGAWAGVVDLDGRVLAATDGAPREALSTMSTIREEALYFDTGDLWRTGAGLEDIAASAILFGASPLAVLVTGRVLDGPAVTALEAVVGRPVAVVSGGAAVPGADASSLDAATLRDLAAFENGTSASVTEVELAGGRFLAAATPLLSSAGGLMGSVVLLGSFDEALEPSSRLRVMLIGLFLAGTLLAFGTSGALARAVTVPVERLLVETERLARDDLEHPIAPMRDDELGRLAESFDAMRVSLKGARTELVRAERLGAIGKAASTVAHDFTQPLSAIAGAIGLLRLDDVDPAVREKCFTSIEGELDRLQRMKQEIVEFARGESSLDEAEVRIDSFLENTISALRLQLERRDISLSIEHGYTGDWYIDSYRLERVLENLVRNAAAAIKGPGTIRLRSRVDDDALVLEVEDDGPGIPEGRLEEIFEPFVSFGKKEGTGLGLAIARNVVQQHRGTIDVASRPGETRFTITLPRRGRITPEAEARKERTAPS